LLSLLAGGLAAEAQALQCVPFAREQSGISLRGDAWTWWMAAAGQYDRGQAPRPGAVVVFKKHGSMSHGHVAVVAEVINSRKVMVDHANWAPHRGRGRGQVAKMVVVTDVSPRNDWSQVRVWNEASGELGQRVYPTYGFIYPRAGHLSVDLIAAEALADSAPAPLADGSVASAGDQPSAFGGASLIGAVASLADLMRAPPNALSGFSVDPGFSQ
jgi:hypothetical protein